MLLLDAGLRRIEIKYAYFIISHMCTLCMEHDMDLHGSVHVSDDKIIIIIRLTYAI